MLVPRIIAILMCLQVLVCPVLCNDFCDFHEQFGSAPSQLEVPPACHCCDSGTSEGGGSDAPAIHRPNAVIVSVAVLSFQRPIRSAICMTSWS